MVLNIKDGLWRKMSINKQLHLWNINLKWKLKLFFIYICKYFLEKETISSFLILCSHLCLCYKFSMISWLFHLHIETVVKYNLYIDLLGIYWYSQIVEVMNITISYKLQKFINVMSQYKKTLLTSHVRHTSLLFLLLEHF